MIREAYYEESAACARGVKEAKLYTLFKVVAIAAFIVAGFILSFAFTFVPALIDSTVDKDTGAVYVAARVFYIVSYFVTIALIAGAGVLFWFLKNRFNVSYDYLFVEDELRIAKVFNGKKRKYLKTFKCDQILKIGRCEKPSFERTCAGLSKKQIVFLTPNRVAAENKDFYYILYSSSLEKTVNIVEAKVELIDFLVRAAGRSKWDPQ